MRLTPKARAFLASPFPVLGAWVIGGLLSIFVPLVKWKNQRKQWYDYYGRYVEYENNQRAYEEQQENQYNNNNNNNNGNNNNGQNGNYDRDGNWYPSCSWWQFKCRQRRFAYMNANNDGDDNNIQFPNWYATIGGRTEEDREGEEMEGAADEAPGAVKFVYTWTLLVFIAMLIFGGITIFKRKALTPLIVIMLIVGQFALLQLLLLGQGVIVTEGREMEDSVYGWYGQLAVLM